MTTHKFPALAAWLAALNAMLCLSAYGNGSYAAALISAFAVGFTCADLTAWAVRKLVG